MLAKNIKEQILNRIKDKNLNIFSLEQKAGRKKGTASNIINEKSINPTIGTLHAIAEVLGCTVDELVSNPGYTRHQQIKKVEDYEFTIDLFWETVEALITKLTEKKAIISLNQAFDIIKEAYIYGLIKKNKTTDHQFIEWLLENKLKP